MGPKFIRQELLSWISTPNSMMCLNENYGNISIFIKQSVLSYSLFSFKFSFVVYCIFFLFKTTHNVHNVTFSHFTKLNSFSNVSCQICIVTYRSFTFYLLASCVHLLNESHYVDNFPVSWCITICTHVSRRYKNTITRSNAKSNILPFRFMFILLLLLLGSFIENRNETRVVNDGVQKLFIS